MFIYKQKSNVYLLFYYERSSRIRVNGGCRAIVLNN